MSARHWWSGVRARLTLSYVAATLAVLGIYAGGVYLFVSRNASRALDSRIRADFLWASEMWDASPDGRLTWFDADAVQQDEDNPWLQVWRPDGELAFQTAVAKRLPIEGSAPLARRASGVVERVRDGRLTFRVLSRALTVGEQPVVIQVARSEAPMRQELYQLVLFLGLGLPFGVFAAALGGYALAHGALSPVRRMAARAQTISADRLHDRLPVDNPHDELGQLARVFNLTLERLERSFEQMQRFTADVSHELRTPLTAMRTVGEVTLRHEQSSAAYQASIGSMLEDADRLTALVDQLLTLSRAEASEQVRAERIELGELAEEVTTYLTALADVKGQTISLSRPMPVYCRADRVLLRQALINLVDNAVKYGHDGAAIAVRVAATPGESFVEVIDDGPGIPAEQLAHVFDRFYRGSSAAESRSHGLGLAIVKAAVEASGGTVCCDSVVGRGSTFRVTLPREADATISAPARVAAAPTLPLPVNLPPGPVSV